MRDKKLALVRGDVVIWGVDIAKAKHWARPVRPDSTAAGKAIIIDNKRNGFRAFTQAIEEVMRREGARRTVVAMEPTGSYWRPLAQWLKDAGYAVVLVNPFHVKQEKERSDNTPSKSDRKDCRIIAELAARGDYLLPIFPEGHLAVLREMTEARKEERQRWNAAVNRVHAVLGARFPEFLAVFKDVTGKAAMWVLRHCPTPAAVLATPREELICGLKAATGRRVGQKRAGQLMAAAMESVGVREGAGAVQERLQGYLDAVEASTARLAAIEARMAEALAATGLDQVLCSVPGIGLVTAASFLGEIGDLDAFTRGRQVVKLAGFQLASNSSGEHRGQSRIAKRGRPGLRKTMFMAALGVIKHCPEFRARYERLKGRAENPLSKPQAVVAIAMQLIRVLFAMAKGRRPYDPSGLRGALEARKPSAA